jgi:hypothetical protein
MKYKAGDKVRVKSLGWYNANKDANGHVTTLDPDFRAEMRYLCGQEKIIERAYSDGRTYKLKDVDFFVFSDEMLEDAHPIVCGYVSKHGRRKEDKRILAHDMGERFNYRYRVVEKECEEAYINGEKGIDCDGYAEFYTINSEKEELLNTIKELEEKLATLKGQL